MERVKNILLAAVVVALVAPAMAIGTEWSGAVDSDWGNAANWYGAAQNEWYTVNERVNAREWQESSPGAGDWFLAYIIDNMPVITAGVNTTHGAMRFSEGVTVTQTGGNVTIFNGADSPYSFAMFGRNASTANYLNISSGSFTVWDGLALAKDNAGVDRIAAVENVINISGDGVLTLYDSENRPLALHIGANSRIEIADQGVFRVSLLPGGTVVEDYVDNLIATNKIVGIGNAVEGEVVGGYYVVSIPEPATMALLGLGAVALLRRKR